MLGAIQGSAVGLTRTSSLTEYAISPLAWRSGAEVDLIEWIVQPVLTADFRDRAEPEDSKGSSVNNQIIMGQDRIRYK